MIPFLKDQNLKPKKLGKKALKLISETKKKQAILIAHKMIEEGCKCVGNPGVNGWSGMCNCCGLPRRSIL